MPIELATNAVTPKAIKPVKIRVSAMLGNKSRRRPQKYSRRSQARPPTTNADRTPAMMLPVTKAGVAIMPTMVDTPMNRMTNPSVMKTSLKLARKRKFS